MKSKGRLFTVPLASSAHQNNVVPGARAVDLYHGMPASSLKKGSDPSKPFQSPNGESTVSEHSARQPIFSAATPPRTNKADGAQQDVASVAKALPGKRRRLLIAPCCINSQPTPAKELLQPSSGALTHISPSTPGDAVAASPAVEAKGRLGNKVQTAGRTFDQKQQSIVPEQTAQADTRQHDLPSPGPVTPAPDARGVHAAVQANSARAASKPDTLLITGSEEVTLTAQGKASPGSCIAPQSQPTCPVHVAAAAQSAMQPPAGQPAGRTSPAFQGVAVKAAQAVTSPSKGVSSSNAPAASLHSNLCTDSTPAQAKIAGLRGDVHPCRALADGSTSAAQHAALSASKPSRVGTTGISSSTKPPFAGRDVAPFTAFQTTSQSSHTSKGGITSAQPEVKQPALVRRLPAVLTASLPSAKSLGIDLTLPKASAMLGQLPRKTVPPSIVAASAKSLIPAAVMEQIRLELMPQQLHPDSVADSTQPCEATSAAGLMSRLAESSSLQLVMEQCSGMMGQMQELKLTQPGRIGQQCRASAPTKAAGKQFVELHKTPLKHSCPAKCSPGQEAHDVAEASGLLLGGTSCSMPFKIVNDLVRDQHAQFADVLSSPEKQAEEFNRGHGQDDFAVSVLHLQAVLGY